MLSRFIARSASTSRSSPLEMKDRRSSLFLHNSEDHALCGHYGIRWTWGTCICSIGDILGHESGDSWCPNSSKGRNAHQSSCCCYQPSGRRPGTFQFLVYEPSVKECILLRRERATFRVWSAQAPSSLSAMGALASKWETRCAAFWPVVAMRNTPRWIACV